MQNRTFLVLLRPIFAEKLKTATQRIWVVKLWSRCRELAWTSVWISDFGRRTRLNFGEDVFFFLRSPVFGLKNHLNFRFWPKNPSQFRINRVILIREQWKFGSRSLAVVSLFQKSPPSFFKSWLRAWLPQWTFWLDWLVFVPS